MTDGNKHARRPIGYRMAVLMGIACGVVAIAAPGPLIVQAAIAFGLVLVGFAVTIAFVLLSDR